MRIGEPLVHPFRRVDFSDGDVGVVQGKLREHRFQALAVAAPRRVEVEYYKFVRGVFEERADGRGVDLDDFRRGRGCQGADEERPRHQRWMAVHSLSF